MMSLFFKIFYLIFSHIRTRRSKVSEILWRGASETRGIILYLEFQSVCPFVRIGFPPPPPTSALQQASVSTLGNQRGEQHSLAGAWEGWGANLDDWRESLALCILYAREGQKFFLKLVYVSKVAWKSYMMIISPFFLNCHVKFTSPP